MAIQATTRSRQKKRRALGGLVEGEGKGELGPEAKGEGEALLPPPKGLGGPRTPALLAAVALTAL